MRGGGVQSIPKVRCAVARRCFRPELVIYAPRESDSDTRYTVYDPVTDISFFLGDRELLTARLFDGRRDLEEIAELLAQQHRLHIPVRTLGAFEERLDKLGLLSDLGNGISARLRDPAIGISYGPLKSRLMFQILRIQPTAMLDVLYEKARWLCSPYFVICSLGLICLAFVYIYLERNIFWSDALAVYGSSLGWLPWHYVVIIVSIAAHETGHALSCRAYNVRVTDFGIAVYLFLATGWARPLQRDWSKLPLSKRLVTIVMGPFASLLFASCGVGVWTLAPPMSIWNTLGVVMVVSSTMPLIPTLLPIFNGDAYLALTEVVGVPRLRQQAYRYVRDVLRRRPVAQMAIHRKALYWTTVITTLLGSGAVWLAIVGLVAWLLIIHLR